MSDRKRSTAPASGLNNLVNELAKPGRIRDLARKLQAQIRYRLLAFTRPRTTLRRHHALEGKTVVVYTLGKVGSSSVYNSLVKSFPFRQIFHVHFMSREWLDRRLPGTPFAREIRAGRRVLSALNQQGRETLYICMIRDPVARDLSNVIQNHAANGIDIGRAPMEDIVGRLRSDGHGFGELWFETEFADHLGRDVLSFPFDKSRGYAIHRIDDSRQLLLLRLEGLNEVFNEAFSQYLGVDVDQQTRFNDSSTKPEAKFYDKLRASYRLPESELNKIYGSRTMRHFYLDGQLEEFRARWREE